VVKRNSFATVITIFSSFYWQMPLLSETLHTGAGPKIFVLSAGA